MAHKKAGGSSRNGRDSNPKYRGVKCSDGQHVAGGYILVRQVGSHFHPGKNVVMGRDYTLVATCEGRVQYARKGPKQRRVVSVVTEAA